MTIAEKGKFLKKLKQTGGNVSAAAKAIGFATSTIYDHRKKDADFEAAFNEILEAGIDDLEQEVRRRAYKGVKKPVFQGGVKVGEITEYSNTLAIFLLKAARPEKYRERHDINTHVTGELDLNIEHEISRIYGDIPTTPDVQPSIDAIDGDDGELTGSSDVALSGDADAEN